jgi:lipopolysaccharide/colanic/teichoic acid biosynthesis glycosyltransferase
MYKFRTMRVDHGGGAPSITAANDPRVFPFGAFLRATKIDELPQLINVLKGDMSVVGPRPERPYFVKRFLEDIAHYDSRHRLKVGITGWAQINYPYGASIRDAREKLTYDLYYVKNFSLFFDFIILLQTLRVVLWPQGVR